MPWNPDKYNKFKDIRYQPFFDLVKMISAEEMRNAVDLGCGTGEQTSILASEFSNASFLGIDPSEEMLQKSKAFQRENLRFSLSTVEEFLTQNNGQQWDLVFSNAALQWSDDHESLFPKLISILGHNGQFAVQMPVQNENLLNKLLLDLVHEKPYSEMLKGWKRESPLLSIDQYAQIMFKNGLNDIQIVQKIYPIIAENTAILFDFISGSALVPYMERIPVTEREQFITEYKSRITKAFGTFPAIYAFKRLLLYGTKKAA